MFGRAVTNALPNETTDNVTMSPNSLMNILATPAVRRMAKDLQVNGDVP
jgi:hypothetical protein